MSVHSTSKQRNSTVFINILIRRETFGVPLTGLTKQTFCVCPKTRTRISIGLFVFSDIIWKVFVVRWYCFIVKQGCFPRYVRISMVNKFIYFKIMKWNSIDLKLNKKIMKLQTYWNTYLNGKTKRKWE